MKVDIEYTGPELSLAGHNQEITIEHSGTLRIGRAPTCDLVVDHHRVSRRHAELHNTNDGPALVDLESTNGTYLNGKRVDPSVAHPLRDEDLVQIANVLVLRIHDPAGTTVGGTTKPYLSSRLWLDPATQQVYVQRKAITPPLPVQQFQLLQMLHAAEGAIVTRDAIAFALWPDAAGGVNEAMIDNTVARLRRRLKETNSGTDMIETVRGVGYRLRG